MPTHRCVDLPRQSKLRRVTCALSLCYSMLAQGTLHRVHEDERMLQAQECSRWFKLGRGPLSPLCLVPQPSRPAWLWRNRISPTSLFTLLLICSRWSVRHHLASDRRQDGRRARSTGRGREPNWRGGLHRRNRLCGAIGPRRLHDTEHHNSQRQATSCFRRACRRGLARTSPRSQRLPTPQTFSSCIRRSACKYSGRVSSHSQKKRTCSTRPPVSDRRRT